MSDNDSTTYQQQPAPTHQDFHWIDGHLQGTSHANFVETTLDIAAGMHAALQLAYTNALEHAANDDADAGQTAPPAVGIVMADQLLRLAMAASGLLSDEARRQVEWINEADAI